MLGQIIGFVYRTTEQKSTIKYIIIKFDDKTVGQKLSMKNQHLSPLVKNENGVPIERTTLEYHPEGLKKKKPHEIVCSVTQVGSSVVSKWVLWLVIIYYSKIVHLTFH